MNQPLAQLSFATARYRGRINYPVERIGVRVARFGLSPVRSVDFICQQPGR
jgi:hypothetical protein